MLWWIDGFYHEGDLHKETSVAWAQLAWSMLGCFITFFDDVFAFQELYPEGTLEHLTEEKIVEIFETFRNEREVNW